MPWHAKVGMPHPPRCLQHISVVSGGDLSTLLSVINASHVGLLAVFVQHIGADCQLVVICGRNAKLVEKLSSK